MKFLRELSNEDLQNWFLAIDTVLFDIDGVLLQSQSPIPGAIEAVQKIRNLGKKIAFVTNSPLFSVELFCKILKPFGATPEEIVNPNITLLAHLQNINYQKDIYIIASNTIKSLLRQAGYNLIEYKDIQEGELIETAGTVRNLSVKALEICRNVGIVYADIDINVCYGSVQIAKYILNHLPNVQLLSGLNDDLIPMDETKKVIGSQFYLDGLERWTKKEAIKMAKPGTVTANFIKTKFNISDESRVLMIGDNPATDIAFGANAGFQTCLVLSGLVNEVDVKKWKYPENYKANYVASGLGEIFEIIKDF